MDENKASGGGYDPYKSWDEPLFRNNSQDASGSAKDSNKENNESEEIPDSPITTIKNPNHKWWKKPEHILGLGMLLINGILAFYTWKLFEKASEQTSAAVDALKEAKRANNISDKNYGLAKIANDSNNASSDRLYGVYTDAAIAAKKSADISYKAFDETKKSYAFSRESSMKELRAYLSIGFTEVTEFSEGRPVVFNLNITNLGKTPANKVKCQISSVATTGNSYDVFDILLSRLNKQIDTTTEMSLWPNKSVHHSMFTKKISRQEIEQLISEKSHYFVMASCVYFDVFGVKHTSRAYTRFNFETGKFDLCKEFNYSD